MGTKLEKLKAKLQEAVDHSNDKRLGFDSTGNATAAAREDHAKKAKKDEYNTEYKAAYKVYEAQYNYEAALNRKEDKATRKKNKENYRKAESALKVELKRTEDKATRKKNKEN